MDLIATRRLDELGRVTLPMEVRKKLQLEPDTAVRIYFDGEKIVLQKAEPSCKICGKESDLTKIAGKDAFICAACRQSIQKSAEQ